MNPVPAETPVGIPLRRKSKTEARGRAALLLGVLLVVAVAAFLIGLFVAKFIPIAGRTDFWADVLSGPPAAGLFAVAAAGVAFLAAKRGTDTAKYAALQNTQSAVRNARRQEWWNRAEWALNLAMSDDSSNRAVGIETLRLMLTDAEQQEAAMLNRVITDVSGGTYKHAEEELQAIDAKTADKQDNEVEGGDDK